jgi:hypothetical protein
MIEVRLGVLSKLRWLTVGALATAAFFACGEAPGESSSVGRRVLARNVLLGNAGLGTGIRTANAEGNDIDTNTKLVATNVVYESNGKADLQATNVQSALEELAVKLDVVLPGSWCIENRNQEAQHAATGAITFAKDGTFKLVRGSFAAIGMGSTDLSGPVGCAHAEEGQTYELFSPRVAAFRHLDPVLAISVVPTLIEARPDRLSFLGSGGCGQVGLQRVSILTRTADVASCK